MAKIDVHCHAVPPKYRQRLIENGHQNPDGMPAIPPWSIESHLSLMKTHNIGISVLSITSPGTFLSPGKSEDAVQITRETNEELASICTAHSDSFRFFASLPLPSVEDSLKEIDHALDVLGAVGFALMSNAHGIYLGDPSLDPVMAKLDERKAIVFLHPTSCNLIVPDPSTGGNKVEVVNVLPYPRPTMEFMFDETRTVANLLLSGSLAKYPNITFIMSHCGCTLPPIIDRIGAFDAIVHGRGDNSQNFKALLQERFFFDLAGVPFPDQIFGLVRMLGGREKARSRLLFGSDFPFTPGEAVKGLVARMEAGFEDREGGEVKVLWL
ncbi:amidohydrolase 2 [Cadophora sp. DSE1049]|nr:amidohydrolase 2 [Cadophora sp. DSE1049]